MKRADLGEIFLFQRTFEPRGMRESRWRRRRTKAGEKAMEKVLVVGAGFMGSGIAQVSAQAGYEVHLMDIQAAITDRALKQIQWSVEKLAAKGLLTEIGRASWRERVEIS